MFFLGGFGADGLEVAGAVEAVGEFGGLGGRVEEFLDGSDELTFRFAGGGADGKLWLVSRAAVRPNLINQGFLRGSRRSSSIRGMVLCAHAMVGRSSPTHP